MNLEVVGRHALLFDDDAMANFVNSADALVDWNSLAIDRYDVRHLLSGPPPPRRRRSPPSAESDLDYERYLDLPSPSDEHQDQQTVTRLPNDVAGGFHTVGFSYEGSGKSTEHKDMNAECEASHFSPPFPVPENLVENLRDENNVANNATFILRLTMSKFQILGEDMEFFSFQPPTEKVHQIIARTAKFVSEHGGQSEVVLRVKQGDNPTFGFLMPHHHLHAYFRFLVDHQELLGANEGNDKAKTTTLEQSDSCTGGNGALSLLSSLYGTGEDEENIQKSANKSEEETPEVNDALESKVSQETRKTIAKDLSNSNDSTAKEKVSSKRNSILGSGTVGISKSLKKVSEVPSKHVRVGSMEKVQASDMLEMPKPEAIILEPPSDMKKLIDKIVEFVQRNGKEVETVLREQDIKHGRFPFLVSSNLYHPYYQKILQKTQESSTTEKSASKKDNPARNRKKTAGAKESDALSTDSVELPFDANRRDKFTMVLGKSKEQVQASKASDSPSEVGMDATTIAAILQAATRGAKFPTLKFASKTSVNGSSLNVDGQASSASVSCPQNPGQNHELHNASVPVAKYIAKTAALAAASEADSLEASMTKEEKLKAERLKRAKLFAAMIKGGGSSIKSELLRGNSAERPESGASGVPRGSSVDRPESGAAVLVGEFGAQSGGEREGSSIPPIVKTLEENEKLEMKVYDNEDKERRSKRSYRSKSKKNADTDEEVCPRRKSRKKHKHHGSDEESAGDEDGDKKFEGHSRKKRRSQKNDDEIDDVDENGGKVHSRKKHRSRRYDDDDEYVDANENGGNTDSRKKHRSHRSSHDSKERHRHSKDHSSKHHSHTDLHKHHSSSDDEHRHHKSSSKRAHKSSHADNGFEEGENSTRFTDETRASCHRDDASCPKETTAADIPDELRAKVRAMLLATL